MWRLIFTDNPADIAMRPGSDRETTSKRRISRRRGERHAMLLSRHRPEAANAQVGFLGIGRCTPMWVGNRRVAGASRFQSAPWSIGVSLQPAIP